MNSKSRGAALLVGALSCPKSGHDAAHAFFCKADHRTAAYTHLSYDVVRWSVAQVGWTSDAARDVQRRREARARLAADGGERGARRVETRRDVDVCSVGRVRDVVVDVKDV